MNISPMELAEGIYSGARPDSRPALKRRLESLVKPVVVLRKLAEEVGCCLFGGDIMLTGVLFGSGGTCVRFNSTVTVAHQL